MPKDNGVTPGLVERKFRRSAWNDYTSRTSRQQAKAGYVDREGKKLAVVESGEALDKLQATRPLKPPRQKPRP